MKKAFEERVIRERIVDTAKFRYVAIDRHNDKKQWVEIRRLPLEELGTTAALDGWERVCSTNCTRPTGKVTGRRYHVTHNVIACRDTVTLHDGRDYDIVLMPEKFHDEPEFSLYIQPTSGDYPLQFLYGVPRDQQSYADAINTAENYADVYLDSIKEMWN